MTNITAAPGSFPVTYYQEHPYSGTRAKFAMLTGLPATATAAELAQAHVAVVRKGLQRGLHIPEILVWHPDPSDNDFPLKEQAALMDEFIKREHATIPIEVAEVEEEPGGIRVVYRVLVTEEQLIDEEQRRDGLPDLAPPKEAGISMGRVLIGAAVFGGFAYWLMPKNQPTPRFLVATTVGILGGTVVGVALKRKQEAGAP
jgi:hypothetical protein